ncbi:MAG: hypothetical protein K0Q79_779 [Flavipsychrobacter sp.]|jgi:hypothetical protein|nr:hypothetical protein [Flavipsychrobacter sp.]
MSISTLPMQQINNFFETYATALERYDTKGMAYLYNIPCTMVSDDTTTMFNDAGKLEGFFNMGAGFYRQFGIAKVRPEIWNRRNWTDKIVNVKVNWQYYDNLDKPIYNCDYHYVLKLDKNNHWRIVLSVSVNEKERMEEWKVKAKGTFLDTITGQQRT